MSGASDAELRPRLLLLARIASGLCRDAGVSRVVLGPDDHWAWNGATRELQVGRATLEREGVEACAGIIAHEVGHSFLSRYHIALPRHSVGAFQSGWMNAIEDTRVERWMTLRYPGVADWLDSTAQAAEAMLGGPGDLPMLRTSQWGLGACLEGTSVAPHVTPFLDPWVTEALLATRAARLHYRDGFLPSTHGQDWEAEGYRLNAEWMALRDLHPVGADVDPRERYILILALHALAYAEREIIPAVEALLEQDIAELGTLVAGDHVLVRVLTQRTRVGLPKPDRALREARLGQREVAPARALHLALARRWLEMVGSQAAGGRGAAIGQGAPGEESEGEQEGSGEGSRGAAARRRREAQEHEVQPIAAPRQALVARVERAFADTLRRERMACRARHAHSGVRADLRRVLHNEGPAAGDPSRWMPAFHRATRSRPDAAFGLLIDCSGSMSGSKVHAAVEAAHVFIEALQRVGVPFFVAGFQDQLIPLATTGCTLAEARQALAGVPLEVHGCRPGGHNNPMNNDDGPCLLEAAAMLRRVPAAQRVLLVLSDGRPAGRRSTPEDLHAAVRSLTLAGDIDLLGVGIGAKHVAEFYPRHVVVDDVRKLPEAVASALAG